MSFLKLKQPELFYTRLYYFVYMGGSGFVLPFVNLFYISLGLNGKQVGTITSAGAIVGLVAAPIVISEIKKLPKARSFLQLILVLGALGYFLIGQQISFLPIIAIVLMQALAVSSAAPLSDALAVSVSQANEAGYGSVRVFGSLGWIFIVPFSGWLIQRLGFGAGFTGVSLAWCCAAGLIFLIPFRYFTSHSVKSLAKPGLREVIQKIFNNPILFGFMVALLAITFLNNGIQQFENVYLSNLGASKQLISIAGILSAMVELPFMLLSDRIMHRIGAHRMLLIALLLTLAQRLTVFLLPSIVTIMIVRFIGGMAYSFYTISYIGLISAHTEPNETGTVLALFTVTLVGLVNIVASPIAGALYDAAGGRWLYACAAAGYAIAASSLWLTRPGRYSKRVV